MAHLVKDLRLWLDDEEKRRRAHHNDFTSEGKNGKHTTAQGGMRHGKKGSAWWGQWSCLQRNGAERALPLVLIPLPYSYPDFLPSLCRS
ncbi:hypothetical protein SESBI_37860 [Sesbania bispinosa]|nr:hypothetical protein SESBI_37860 [Sesbania bispinosa]